MNFYLRHDACGGPAFYINHRPETGEKLMAKDHTNVDGTPVYDGNRIMCGTCGDPLGSRDLLPSKVFEVDHAQS